MKPFKDRPILNYFKMKWERHITFILWAIAFVSLIITCVVVMTSNNRQEFKPKDEIIGIVEGTNNIKPKLIFSEPKNTGFVYSNQTIKFIENGILKGEYKLNDSLKLRQSYCKGYEDALLHLSLLNLELILKEERKTFGEMFEMLYERYDIK